MAVFEFVIVDISVADPGSVAFLNPGSGIRIPLSLLLFMDPGSGMSKNQDPG